MSTGKSEIIGIREKQVNCDGGNQNEGHSEGSVFDTEEIRIEELAIDGICGVY
jgi:mycofactocin precursor